MKSAMECQRAEELFSDHQEGGLEEPLRSELGTHLAECGDCRELHQALAEVVEALRTYPVVEPSAQLPVRAAAAALAQARPTRRRDKRRASMLRVAWRTSVPTLPIAAALIMGVSTAFLLGPSVPRPLGSTERLMERTENAREYLLEQKECLIEDIRILRVVIATAFEGRLDRVNARVDDYRRLLQEKRDAEQHRQGRGEEESSWFRVLSAEGPPSFRNQAGRDYVVVGVAPAERG